MKGSIRFILGLVLVLGAVGTTDADPNASILVQSLIGVVGLLVMASGTAALRKV